MLIKELTPLKLVGTLLFTASSVIMLLIGYDYLSRNYPRLLGGILVTLLLSAFFGGGYLVFFY